MKKHSILYLLLILAITSCVKSNEQKAQELADKATKENLYIPDSYDPISIELDSAFAPFDSPEFTKLITEMTQVGQEVSSINEEIAEAEKSMAIWGDGGLSEYGKLEYNQAKEKYDKAQQSLSNAQALILQQREKFLEMKNHKKEFIGFKGVLKFRAKNNAGNVLMGNNVFLFDKEITKIINMYDDEEYQTITEMSKLFLQNM